MTDTCTRGHEYTPENTFIRNRVRPDRKATITRVCRTCQAAAQRETYNRQAWKRIHALYLTLLAQRGVL